jgi:alanyl-tRNA synthetase
MTSAEIRQSFLNFFREKQHTIVPSSSLLPDAPNLLFTNAGMNQFVPIFLGQRAPDVDKWPRAERGSPTRAADTQKCIRAGGKHNDLEDVGLDTYHHTFFEMLGNWSFGDYFKKEAIDWAWELVVERWHFPKERLYATYFEGDDDTPADTEARDLWRQYLTEDHIVPGNRKDNFWMMGDTGPCGPCSEMHIDLTPNGDGGAKLVNAGSPLCIEIWNLVFIEFNAQIVETFRADFPQEGLVAVFPTKWKFDPLPAKHVDTGMGFERVCSMIQCTKGFTDFTRPVSNYETDGFKPIFRELEKLSGYLYTSTLPSDNAGERGNRDIAFRVIADHIRCLSFAIADGIQPSNEGRGYVLRRILRRAVRYGRTLGFREPFFYKLVDVLAVAMGDAFPEIRKERERIKEVVRLEEESFNKTLDTGIVVFEAAVRTSTEAAAKAAEIRTLVAELKNRVAGIAEGRGSIRDFFRENMPSIIRLKELTNFISSAECLRFLGRVGSYAQNYVNQLLGNARGETVGDVIQGGDRFLTSDTIQTLDRIAYAAGDEELQTGVFPGRAAFVLYDTHGFPSDLTQLMAREHGLRFDISGFETLMKEQRERARADHDKKKSVVTVETEDLHVEPTKFLGYDNLEIEAVVEVVSPGAEKSFDVILDKTPFYAEMGGQVGDTGLIGSAKVLDTQKQGNVFVHRSAAPLETGQRVRAAVDVPRRQNIQRHHTVTHLFHWALHEVVSREARQKGSLVAPDRLRFDFNHPEHLSDQQIADIEKLVNERIKENAPVYWFEMPYADVRGKPNIMQFFGDKYGDVVRIVQIGGHDKALDGYSMELCGGTHTKTTSEIGLFKIMRESAVAAGVRRIEAVCGQFATEFLAKQGEQEKVELEKAKARELEKEQAKQRQAAMQSQAPAIAEQLLGRARPPGAPLVDEVPGADANLLRAVVDVLKTKVTSGVVVLGGAADGKVSLICYVTPNLVNQGKHAGKIVGELAKICGGGGGGKPDVAQAGGKQPEKLAEALAAVSRIVSS